MGRLFAAAVESSIVRQTPSVTILIIMRMTRFIIGMLTTSMLSGCASKGVLAPVDDKTAVEEQIRTVDSQQQAPTHDSEKIIDDRDVESAGKEAENSDLDIDQPDALVLALISKAEQQMSEGDIENALASLKRGARLKPKDPWLWHSLAVLRLQNQEWQEAISFAEKSIALSGSNSLLLAGNWQIVTMAKRALGDVPGAKEAERKMENYQLPVNS